MPFHSVQFNCHSGSQDSLLLQQCNWKQLTQHATRNSTQSDEHNYCNKIFIKQHSNEPWKLQCCKFPIFPLGNTWNHFENQLHCESFALTILLFGIGLGLLNLDSLALAMPDWDSNSAVIWFYNYSQNARHWKYTTVYIHNCSRPLAVYR